MTEYEISRAAGQCSVSGRAFAEDETFYTVVLETPQGFERRDISQECWEGPPEDALCHFKARLPRKEQPSKTFVDDEVLVDFFRRLANTKEGHKLRFRFVLSLILMRKRLLKYEGTIRRGDGEFWEMRLVRDKSLHRVSHPSMNEAEIEALTRELGEILEGHASGEDDLDTSDSVSSDQGGEAPN